MHILSYILILFIIACASEETTSPDQKQNTPPATTLTSNDSANIPENTEEESDNTPALVEESTQDIPEKNPVMPTAIPVITETQAILNQLHGVYQFNLDVYQNWKRVIWTAFNADTPVFMTLAQNHRPNVEQLLIEIISGADEDPVGKFCVVQSNFELQKPQNSNGEAVATSILALQAIANEGGIVDINNVKNTIKINTYEPLDFTIEFYGDHGSESIDLSTQGKISENITQDFDSLCRFCGFEVGQNGLCQ